MQEPNPSAPATQSPENQAQGQSPSEKAVQNQGSPQPPMLPPPPPIAPPPAATQRLPNWLQQAERLLRVVVRIYIGLIVCVVPWIPSFWDANPLFSSSPWLMDFITHGWLRGLVSGFGLLNLWFALRDALHPTETPVRR